MPKINKDYQSLFEYLIVKDLGSKHLSNALYKQSWGRQQILGGLQPIADMVKDFVDTFKPYKARYQAKRDFQQPIRGIGNIAKGVAYLIVAPLLFFRNTIRYAFSSDSLGNFVSNMVLNSYRTASWLLNGVLSLVQGITQVAAMPLTWLIKIPFRRLITIIKGAPKIEQNQDIKNLLADANNIIAQKNMTEDLKYQHLSHYIPCALHLKFFNAITKGQNTDISLEHEKNLFLAERALYHHWTDEYSSDKMAALLQYIGLFSEKDAEEPKKSLELKPLKRCP